MISWLVVGILVVLALIALKMNRFRHKIWILLIIFIVLFFYVTLSVVYSQHKIEINTVEGFFSAAKIYFGWLGNGFQNLKVLAGNAIKLDWTETNGTFFNKTEKIEPKKI